MELSLSRYHPAQRRSVYITEIHHYRLAFFWLEASMFHGAPFTRRVSTPRRSNSARTVQPLRLDATVARINSASIQRRTITHGHNAVPRCPRQRQISVSRGMARLSSRHPLMLSMSTCGNGTEPTMVCFKQCQHRLQLRMQTEHLYYRPMRYTSWHRMRSPLGCWFSIARRPLLCSSVRRSSCLLTAPVARVRQWPWT